MNISPVLLGKSIGEEFANFLAESQSPIAIYSGRFQPFHAGHYHAYQDLVNKFGKDRVFIATSNKTEPGRSPFSFDEKKAIITKMFDIPPENVVMVKNPYSAEEITKRFPEDTPVVWGLGDKDRQRLAIGGKYFKHYHSGSPMVGYPTNGYIYPLPQLQMKVGDQTISGEAIRQVFSANSNEAKKALFKKLYGKFDPIIFKLISTKISTPPEPSVAQSTKSSIVQNPPMSKDTIAQYLKTKIKNPETGNNILIGTALKYPPEHPAYIAAKRFLQGKIKEAINESILFEGGAYGHLFHPYEDMDLTFDDLKELVNRSLGTGLGKEGPVVEKTDGQNLMVTFKDGHVRFARNRGHLKNSGANALTSDQIRQMFAGRGEIEQTFGDAARDLEAAIRQLSPEEQSQLFSEGKKFMSVEVIHPSSENVIPYGQKMLVLHQIITFDSEGNPLDVSVDESEQLAQSLKNIEADKQSMFGIRGQQFIVFSDEQSEELDNKKQKYIQELKDLQEKYGLRDESTLRDFKTKSLSLLLGRSGFTWTEQEKQLLINRWIHGQRAQNKIAALGHDRDKMEWAKKIDDKVEEFDSELMLPIQSFIGRLGVDTIARSADLLSSTNPLAGQQIKKKLTDAIKAIKQSNDPNKLRQLDLFLKRVQHMNLERLVPSEGLVFNYKGKMYKYTGLFAPVNRIIGMVKYEKKIPDQPGLPTLKPSSDKSSGVSSPEQIKKSRRARGTAAILNRKIMNPLTGKNILVKTALSYPEEHPAHKIAKKMLHDF